MRSRFTIFVLTFVIVFAMANTRVSFFNEMKNDTDTIVSGSKHDIVRVDSAITEKKSVDTALAQTALSQAIDTLDSLHRAILLHNKAIDDSIRLDSLNRKKKNGIDAPVEYTADDSLVYFAGNKMAHLYGSSTVKYENMDLASEKVAITLDSSLVRATGVYDTTTREKLGTPVFKMGSDTYESDTMAFNFKTKKGLISSVYTEQEDGFLTAERSKRDKEGNLYLKHGRYTTCDEDHPDFYLALSRAKVRPGKDVVFGPAYLVVQDVPLPLAIPYGFFPFSKSYSSGFIMPTYGDETARGFYLRNGGYYFAISDRIDLKLTGEIYTKGSWGIAAASSYRKRYRYSGSFDASYLDTRNGDKGMPDYEKTTNFRIRWSHNQDPKANPYSTIQASVNFATSNYENNNLTSYYNPVMSSSNTRGSSVSWSTQFSSIGLNLSSGINLNQNTAKSSIGVELPDLNVSVSRFFPFRRKYVAGDERWYEKINVSYTGSFKSSIDTKEEYLLHQSFKKHWTNTITHNIPVGATFSLFNAINVTPSINFNDRMSLRRFEKTWVEDADYKEGGYEKTDTVGDFKNVYNLTASIGLNTKLYGMFMPNRKIFGDKIQAIRHVFTPTVSLSYAYAPDYQTQYIRSGKKVNYIQYEGASAGGKTGAINMQISNQLEMKVKSDKDSTGFKKISLIDELGASMSYYMDSKTWSDLTMNIRLKWWKNYTFSLTGRFGTYAWGKTKEGNIVQSKTTHYSLGHFGQFAGMSQSISYTLNPEKIRKLFGGGDDKKKEDDDESDDDYDTGLDTNVDPVMMKGQNALADRGSSNKAETDDDGYMRYSMPWSLTFAYSISMSEDHSKFREYGKYVDYKNSFNEIERIPGGYLGYKFTQSLNVSGNISLSDGWNISFMSGYDFDVHKLVRTSASLMRDLHCFAMSCQVVISPYTSYNFSFYCKASTLADALKYDKRSGYSNNVRWY